MKHHVASLLQQSYLYQPQPVMSMCYISVSYGKYDQLDMWVYNFTL